MKDGENLKVQKVKSNKRTPNLYFLILRPPLNNGRSPDLIYSIPSIHILVLHSNCSLLRFGPFLENI